MSRREDRREDRRDRRDKRDRSPKRRKRSLSPKKRAFTPPEQVEERLRKEAERVKEREKGKMEKMAALTSESERPAATPKVPISVTEFSAKIQQAEEKNSKPVFLSKDERQRLAVQRRQEEVQAQRDKAEAERKRRAALLEEMRAERKAEQRESGRAKKAERSARVAASGDEQNVGETDMEKIRKEYLGIKDRKKRVLKASEKMKFVFGWDASDDTSKDGNPLYDNKVLKTTPITTKIKNKTNHIIFDFFPPKIFEIIF